MWEIIENLPKWKKITGISTLIILIFLLVLYLHGESEAIRAPSLIEEAEQNASSEVIKETTQVGASIASEFHEKGITLSRDVKDPIAKKTVEWGWTTAGGMLALIMFLIVLKLFGKAFGFLR